MANCITALVASSVVLSYLYNSLVLQPLAQFGVVPYTWTELMVIFFRLNMIAPLFTLLLFSFLLDFWENLFAELTMFADRLFYKVGKYFVRYCVSITVICGQYQKKYLLSWCVLYFLRQQTFSASMKKWKKQSW